jgi:hypothetical protein
MQNLHSLEFSRRFLVSCASVPPGLPSIENDAHGTKKFLLKTQVSEEFAE